MRRSVCTSAVSALVLLPGCLWIGDAQHQARLQTTSEPVDTAEPTDTDVSLQLDPVDDVVGACDGESSTLTGRVEGLEGLLPASLAIFDLPPVPVSIEVSEGRFGLPLDYPPSLSCLAGPCTHPVTLALDAGPTATVDVSFSPPTVPEVDEVTVDGVPVGASLTAAASGSLVVALDDPRLDAPGAGAGLRVCGGGSEADDADCIDLATMFGREPGGATAEADLDELADAACTSGWSVVELYALADTSCGASTVRALSGVSLVLDCDDDGYDQLVDCDDGDATRFPGQVEQCDEVDHDCSGEAYDVVEYTAAGSPAAVPLEQLQSALDAADPGTAVEVCGGTHVGPLVWPLGGVSLSSAHGAVLDGGKAGSVITYLPAQEPPETRPVVKLTNVTLTNGLAADGGGLHTVHGRVELVDVIVQGNTATGSGGGIHAEGSQLQGVSLMVSGNVAADGGGLHLMGSELDAIASEVEGNQATTMGGGVMLRDGLVLLDVASMVRGNEAPLGGGVAGVLMRAEVRAGVEGGRISDNVADLGGAFATSSDGGAAAIELTDVTFEGNEAREQGGVIYALQPVRLEGSSSSSSVVPFPHDGQVAFVSGATGQLEVVCNTMESSTYANDDGLLPPPPPPCGTMAGTGTAWVEDTTCSCN